MTNKNEMPDVIYAYTYDTLDDAGVPILNIPTFSAEDPHPIQSIKYTRAAQPQPPVIEGLDEAIEDLENNVCGRGSISDYSDNSLDTVLKAAKLYAQGQTAQPVDLDEK